MKLIEENKYLQLIFTAAERGELGKIKQWLKEFNEINPQVIRASRRFGDGAFDVALSNKHFDIAAYLVESGCYDPKPAINNFIGLGIEDAGNSDFDPANNEDPSEILAFLISIGSELDYPDFGGNTPLDVAVYWHYDSAVKFLIHAGAKHSDAFQKTGKLDSGMRK